MSKPFPVACCLMCDDYNSQTLWQWSIENVQVALAHDYATAARIPESGTSVYHWWESDLNELLNQLSVEVHFAATEPYYDSETEKRFQSVVELSGLENTSSMWFGGPWGGIGPPPIESFVEHFVDFFEFELKVEIIQRCNTRQFEFLLSSRVTSATFPFCGAAEICRCSLLSSTGSPPSLFCSLPLRTNIHRSHSLPSQYFGPGTIASPLYAVTNTTIAQLEHM